MFVSCSELPKIWKGYTLILPCVSVGNVGQLTADLIISTLGMARVGFLRDDSIIPLIGNDPFAPIGNSTCKLMTAAEVFCCEKHQLLVFQLRSGIVKGKRQQFVSRLKDWIRSSEFHQVVILTSSFAHERTDSQLAGTQLRYVATSHFKKTGTVDRFCESLHWKELEQRGPHPAYRSHGIALENADPGVVECRELFIPGGGFVKELLEKCIASEIPAIALIRFCSEGDNIPEAIDLANYVNTWLSLVNAETSEHKEAHGWKIPPSWRLMFGRSLPQALFL